MSDGVSGIGSAPFNIQSDIHQQTRSRERIEKHFEELTYNRTGKLQQSQKEQGLVIDKEV